MKPVLLLLLGLACAPAPLSAGDFEFAVVGDTRPKFESDDFRQFESLIGTINTSKPALVINLGDLIYGYAPRSKEKQWDKYQAVAKTIQAPYYQVPGNHDTHSQEARKIYSRRFGKCYQSFDYGDCHFVLLDNTEDQRWGYLGPAQLAWLKADLKATQARTVFVFLHFPVWEPERVTPAYYEFWAQTLHPLFKASRVRAVFAGHYHAYGPTREFDGIRYFITGGGGAELRPEYKKSGGEYHFMKVKVTADAFDVRVLTERGELTDPEADVMGGLLFAAQHVSRIGIARDGENLRAGLAFSVSVENPGRGLMAGEAAWVLDPSAFAVEPEKVSVQIPAGATHQYTFTLKALRPSTTLLSLPRLEFNVLTDNKRQRFAREVRFLQAIASPYRATPPVLDGCVTEWAGVPVLHLGEDSQAELRSCCDARNLYLALTVPAFDGEEAKESGLSDELQIGLARRLSATDFGGDLLRLGLNADSPTVWDRTPNRKTARPVVGAKSVCRTEQQRTTCEVALPLQRLKGLGLRPGNRLVLDLSFPAPEPAAAAPKPTEPTANTFSYRVRYGSDSLVPVYFVELDLGKKP